MIIGFYSGLRQAGLEPGQDRAVTGFRDSPQSRYLFPPPASFSLALDELGISVAKAITAIAAREDLSASSAVRIVWPMAFRETDSVRALAQAG